MKIIKYLPLLLVLIFTNCDKTEETNQISPELELPNEITYFTYTPNSFIETLESDNWLVIHNQNGKLLDYRAYEKDETLVFTALDTTLITTESLVITTLSLSQNNNSTINRLQTYTDISIGLDWNFGLQSDFGLNNVMNNLESDYNEKKIEASNSKKQPYSITVTNIPGIKKYNIYGEERVVAANYNSIDSDELKLESIELLSNTSYLFFIGDEDGGQKYIYFEVDETADQLVLDYNDYQYFESTLETQLPKNSYLFSVSRGFETKSEFGNKFEMVVELDFNSPEISRIGYIPGFDYYTTSFHLTMNNGYAYRYYEKSLTPLERIDILDKPMFTVKNNSVYDFSFNTDISFIRTGSNWKYEENFSDGSYVFTDWTVNTKNKAMHSIGKLPEEIIEKYSSLFLERINLYSTSLEIQGRTYDSFLENIFDSSNNSQPDILETIIIYASDN